MLEADIELGLRVDAIDLERDAPQFGVDADVESQQIQDMGLQRHARIDLVDLQIDSIDVQTFHVQMHVGLAAGDRNWS